MAPTAAEILDRARATLDTDRGARFTRYCIDVAMGRKAAVPMGTTDGDYDTDGWGAGAVAEGSAEFVGLVRARTVIGRLPRLRRVPFNVAVVRRTGGGVYAWRGEAGAKIVTALGYEKTRLAPRTASAIVVLSRELLSGAPGTLADVQRELLDGVTAFTDRTFLDPANTGTPGIVPASATAGATAIPSSGDAAEDIRALTAAVQTALDTTEDVVFVMSETTALGIATTVAGAFPAGLAGGLFGLVPVLLSAAAKDNIIAIHGPSILVAEGGVRVDSAEHAALQMSDSPIEGAQPLVSLWQSGGRALRVERVLNWDVATPGAVQYISGADYGTGS